MHGPLSPAHLHVGRAWHADLTGLTRQPVKTQAPSPRFGSVGRSAAFHSQPLVCEQLTGLSMTLHTLGGSALQTPVL